MTGGVAKKLVAPALIAAAFAAPAAAQTQHPSVALNALSRGVLAQVNAVRRSHGLVPLRISASLTDAASQHSHEMAADGYFAHKSADGSAFDKRLIRFYSAARVHYWSVGENLVWSAPALTPAEAVDLWMHSPDHRANLLTARWREVGISAVHVASAPGTYGGRPVTIVTADFGVRY
ncbi:MAG: CAP domain-containing protein [Gaiellaceae bacterium]